ncbi:MAG: DUF3450 domain-containing protein [Lentisphaeraceae bacterium]|nr:DUF3450 domain-containing protein [Lentisphaeraceae bacterium]
MTRFVSAFLLILLLPYFLLGADRQDLMKQLDKINVVNRQAAKEKAEWLVEKETLELELKLLKDKLLQKELDERDLAKQLTVLKFKKKSLDDQLAKLEASIEQIQETSHQHLKHLSLRVNSRLPKSLKKLVSKEVAGILKYRDNRGNIMDMLAASRVYFNSVFDLQKKAHLVKEVISLNDKKQQVTVLYIGTSIGFYISQDGTSTGQLFFEENKWVTKERNDLTEKIKSAIQQYNREGKPELIDLPITGVGK